MKKVFILGLFALMMTGVSLNAQVTIGTNRAAKATLEVVASSSVPVGVIAPNISLKSLQGYTYGSDQNGAIVYVTAIDATPDGQTIAITAPGYYYFDSTANVWKGFGGDGGSSTAQRPALITDASQNISITAGQLSADVTVVYCTFPGTAACTLSLPPLTPADKCKIVQVCSNTGGGGVSLGLGGTIPPLMGASFMWDGTAWIRISR